MSLQLIAKQMEAKGRGGDSVLVHMTPEEVAGLQKLAESAGGSLSVNPETGLVEANFLKRMLPTLVGIGVGMFAGPMAGAAAGAAVGGYQAKRNDQDVGMGALMGGLGGYGGGTMGAGLTAAGAGAAGAAAPMTASQTLSQAGQGLTAIGADTAKRAAFAKSVGMSGLGMAAAPMMAPGKMSDPEKIASDDEMYSYTFNPGRTGAERSPSATSAEREYFQSSYSPVRKIRASEYPVYAAQGGLMSLAEGGETAAPTAAEVAAPTASEAALAYLMGERSSSAGLPAVRAPSTPASNVGGDGMYAFDPATGAFTRNPNYVDPSARPASSGGGGPMFIPYTGGAGGGASDNYNPYDGAGSGYNDGSRGLSAGSVNAESIAAGLGSIGYSDAPADMSGFDTPSNNASYGGFFAAGGLMGLAKGGMKSGGFVVPADVVSMIGEGNTDAGYNRIKSMIPGATAIKGKDGGQADTVKTSIEGKQPARVAHGEMYIPPETVKRMGGAKKLYAMMDRVREQATGSKKQIKPVSLKRAMA
jgi:hypothetical protein